MPTPRGDVAAVHRGNTVESRPGLHRGHRLSPKWLHPVRLLLLHEWWQRQREWCSIGSSRNRTSDPGPAMKVPVGERPKQPQPHAAPLHAVPADTACFISLTDGCRPHACVVQPPLRGRVATVTLLWLF